MQRDDSDDERHHYKIGEVAQLLGVRPHVLRYWEQEFPALRPKKTRGAHRHYSRENVALARAIRALVVDEGYSIPGARKRLLEAGEVLHARASDDDEGCLREDLLALRDELSALLRELDGASAEAPEEPLEAPRESYVSVLAPASSPGRSRAR